MAARRTDEASAVLARSAIIECVVDPHEPPMPAKVQTTILTSGRGVASDGLLLAVTNPT